MTKLTLAERETIVRFSDDPSEPMTFETFNKRHAERLITAGATVKRKGQHGGVDVWTLEMPKLWFRWPKPPSAAQSARMKERMLADPQYRPGQRKDVKP